ncbi:CATRA conflict system CASPASE/TPR repeat-associated protein [Phytohabitans suffuscus]|uniref:CATRA conflict system CASPASE/TPR repeat-associated protein n=1 Tax=Phytohabitans suffuscus TaxID=624315 RepID=UPI00156667C0|nr:CATRA conflict system CASPASE/TPR repeat-associated protein [Phytohabitans suffuscus]
MRGERANSRFVARWLPKVYADATSALQALNPVTLTPPDAPAARPGPAPGSPPLRANLLVHRLTLSPSARRRPAASGAGAAGLAPPRATDAAVRQELVVHAFAPLDGPGRDPAYRQIRRMWTAARTLLRASDAIDGGPTDLPAECARLAVGPVVAAQQRADRRVQVVLRREHDVLNLSIGWLADPGAPPRTWAQWERQWDAVAAGGTDELIGVVRLYVGFQPAGRRGGPPARPPVEVAAELAAGLTPDGGTLWNGGVLVDGCVLWELPPFGEHARPERRILALGTPERERELSDLAWWRGEAEMAPLPRYLLDAAKVRYQLRVREAAEASLRGALAGRATAAETAVLLTRLADMRLTVEIARSNMDAVLRALDPWGGSPTGGLFADDRACAAWVQSRLADDVRYMRNAHRRALHLLDRGRFAAHASRLPVIGLVTALPEEFAAMASLVDGGQECAVPGDPAEYVCGTIPSAHDGHPHAVVLTLLTETGTNWAANAVANMLRSFESVDQVLMVGIAAGVPAPGDPYRHVRLGDIVVATWGIVDYDHVVDRPGGVTLRQGFPQPSALLAHRAKGLLAAELRGRRPWEDELERLLERMPGFARPEAVTDRLWVHDGPDSREVWHPDPAASGHRDGLPKVHEGLIGSANRSLRNSARRDALARRYDLRAIEMEGSGIGSSAFAGGRDWLVVRGISDYGDRRLGRLWRPYAAAVAAAYTRALLRRCPPITPHGGLTGSVAS